jgi:farnesyl diphosphate synthase
MDESMTRRGKLCWYQVKGVGLKALNDTLMLEQVVYYILRKYLSRKRCYLKIVNLFHDVSFRTTLGQCLDTISVNLNE